MPVSEYNLCMNKTSKILAVIVGMVILSFVLIGFGKSEERLISIGAIIPQTGFGAYWGDPVLKGIALAESDLQKKYGKENVRILIEDSKSDAATAATVAHKLLSIDKVDGLYTEFSGPSNAVSPIASAAGKPLVYSTFNQKIAETNKNSLKTFISFQSVCEQFGEYVHDPKKKILIISAIADAAPYCKKGLLSSFGENNIKVIEGFTDTDFRTLLLQNKSFAADYIIPIMYEDGGYALAKQKHELKIPGRIFGYKQDVVTDKILRELPHDVTDGTIFFFVPIKKEFADRLRGANPDISDDDIQAAANSYQSIMALGTGLADCPGNKSECLSSYGESTRVAEYGSYIGSKFVNRVLYSDIEIGVVQAGKAQAGSI